MRPETKTVVILKKWMNFLTLSDSISHLPIQMSGCIRSFGARGCVSDDTEAFRNAMKNIGIYLPRAYRAADTITLRPDTVLIGLNPIQPEFLSGTIRRLCGFIRPNPFGKAENGCNIVTGIGIDAGARNPRAVGCRWMESDSYMNDTSSLADMVA